MFLVSIKKALAVGFLVCTFVEVSVARDIPVGIGKNHDFTLTCKAGNFIGVIEGTAGRHFQTGKWVHTKRYKITRINGQSGGNKANVNLSAGKARPSASNRVTLSHSFPAPRFQPAPATAMNSGSQ